VIRSLRRSPLLASVLAALLGVGLVAPSAALAATGTTKTLEVAPIPALAQQDVTLTARAASDDASDAVGAQTLDDRTVAGDGSADKADVTVTLAASRATWETNVPIEFSATVTPLAGGLSLPVTGTVDFSIDGGPAQTMPVVDGTATLPAATLALGPHTVAAAYSGDSSFNPATAVPLARDVVANVVDAGGVGVSGSWIYPVKDSWRDTIVVRGTRNEPLDVTIRVYTSAGKLLSTRAIAAGSGSYSWTWTGRTAGGAILPAGRYTIVQTLADPSSIPALTRAWTAHVALSTRRMRWATITLTRDGNHPARWSGPPSLLSSTRYRAGATLRTPSTTPGWAAFGYSFTLPSATTYTSVAFYAQGGPWSGPTAPQIGLHDWRLGTSWRVMYDATRKRHSVGTSRLAWYGISGDPVAMIGTISGTRTVRAYVDSGPNVKSFTYQLARVKLVVRYGILE
jgi:hypothetical protein